MRNVFGFALSDATVAAVAMLIFLFLMTSKPYLLVIPVVGGVAGYFILKTILVKKSTSDVSHWRPILMIAPALLALIIAAVVIAFVNIL